MPPRDGEQTQAYAAAIQAARAGHPASERLLAEIARNPEAPGIRRATAIQELRRYLSPASTDILHVGAKAEDPLVRSATAELLEAVDPTIQVQLGMSLLKDHVRAVRLAAAPVLAGVPDGQLNDTQRDTLNQALDEYLKAQETNAERPEAHTNLGMLYAARGRFDAAEAAYRKAIDLQPYFVGAYVNLADLYRARGRDDRGEIVLRSGLARLPDNADLHHALGLLQVRRKQYEDAVASLGEATRLNTANAHYSYVYAVALNSVGRTEQALAVLKQAQEHNPVNQELLLALVDMNRAAGNLAAATTYAKALTALAPTDTALQKLLSDLTAQSEPKPTGATR